MNKYNVVGADNKDMRLSIKKPAVCSLPVTSFSPTCCTRNFKESLCSCPCRKDRYQAGPALPAERRHHARRCSQDFKYAPLLHTPNHMYYDSYLLENKARHIGDRIAAVVAVSRDIAEEALELIEVEYEPLPVVTDPLEAIKPGAPAIHSKTRQGNRPKEIVNNILDIKEFELGNVEEGFRQADLIVENCYKTSRPNNAPLERTVVVCAGHQRQTDIWATNRNSRRPNEYSKLF